MERENAVLTPEMLARLIDISAVQAYQGKQEIDELIGYAKKYRFISVHTLPSWTLYVSEQIAEDLDILVGAPVGFPSGGSCMEIKVQEAKRLIEDGVQEMDMVINVGKVRSGAYDYAAEEIRKVREVSSGIPLKVILETHYLTEEQIKRVCEICIAQRADFVKTGTGWAPTGATLDIVRKIKRFVGDDIKIKASGGIRDLETMTEMYRLGVDRFGINVKTSIEMIAKSSALGEGVKMAGSL
jgi:deoxyribose-phosphate aldolase